MYKKIIKKIVENGKQEDMYKISEITEDAMEHLKECNESKYNEIMCDLREIAYGKIITEDMAHEWVVNMKPYGEHWNMETVKSVMEEQDINLRDIDFYVVLNMMYNDFFSVIGDDTETYIKLTISWLEDEDASEHKLYEYWKHVILK